MFAFEDNPTTANFRSLNRRARVALFRSVFGSNKRKNSNNKILKFNFYFKTKLGIICIFKMHLPGQVSQKNFILFLKRDPGESSWNDERVHWRHSDIALCTCRLHCALRFYHRKQGPALSCTTCRDRRSLSGIKCCALHKVKRADRKKGPANVWKCLSR